MKCLPAELQGWAVGGEACWAREQQAAVHPQLQDGCFVGQREGWLLQSLDSGARGGGGSGSGLHSPYELHARPGAQAAFALRPWRAKDPWHLASEPWGLSGQEQWSHYHPQDPISFLAEPDVRGKRDINKQLWGPRGQQEQWPTDSAEVRAWSSRQWVAAGEWGLVGKGVLLIRGWEFHWVGRWDHCARSKAVQVHRAEHRTGTVPRTWHTSLLDPHCQWDAWTFAHFTGEENEAPRSWTIYPRSQS